MRRTRTSTSARLLGIAVLVMVWGLTASRAPVEDVSPRVASFRAVLPSLFPTLSAQTLISGCTNGDVATGNQITITVTKVVGRKTAVPVEDGELITFDETNRDVNLIGASGSVAGVLFTGVTVTPDMVGEYNRLDVTLGSQMTYQGATECVTGGETRYYYSDGSSTSSPCIIGVVNPGSPCTFVEDASVSVALSRSDFEATTVTIGGGETPLPLIYSITADGITLSITMDPSIGAYTLGPNNVVFPAVTPTSASGG